MLPRSPPHRETGLGVCTSRGSSLMHPEGRRREPGQGAGTRTACHPHSASAPSSDKLDNGGLTARSQQNLHRPGPQSARFIHRSQAGSEHVHKRPRLSVKSVTAVSSHRHGSQLRRSPVYCPASAGRTTGSPKILSALDESLSKDFLYVCQRSSTTKAGLLTQVYLPLAATMLNKHFHTAVCKYHFLKRPQL